MRVVAVLVAILVGLSSCRQTVPEEAGIDGAGIDGAAIDGPVDGPTDGPPIDTNTCPTQPCSLSPQCGCTSPLTCDVDFTDSMGTTCRAVSVPGTEVNTCASFSECAAGHVCEGGRCRRYCSVDGDCGQPRGVCAIPLTDPMMNAIPGATTCSANCNPTNSAAGGCPVGQKCGFFTVSRAGTDLGVLDCTTPGASGIGAACVTDATCSSDTMCTTVSGQSRCRKVCNRTGGGIECATVANTTCIGLPLPIIIGGTEFGVCAP